MDAWARTDWLLLLYFLPAARGRARVQAWRRLQRVGAVSVRNSAYVLPHSAESREDFEWIRNEIVSGGGEAMVLAAHAPDAAANSEIVEAFRTARRRDFEQLAGEAGRLLKRSAGREGRSRRQVTQRARRLRERFEEVVRVDFFDAAGRQQAASLLAQLDRSTGRTKPMPSRPTQRLNAADYRRRRWITRRRPGVDRMASAWLVRRFIDPDATFVFGEPDGAPDAIPFDTFEAEFGHRGSDCTFETLCRRFGIGDSAALRIGRLVHDLDLKENRYGERDTETVGHLVEGLRRTHRDDAALLQSGIGMFEALFQSSATAEKKDAKRRARTRNPKRKH